jgi:hypothetical protein
MLLAVLAAEARGCVADAGGDAAVAGQVAGGVEEAGAAARAVVGLQERYPGGGVLCAGR